MNAHRCPIAGPLAWSAEPDSGCNRTAFSSHLPTNDLPVVSLRSSADASSHVRGCSGVAVGVDECRGVVVRCPLARLFARLRSDFPLIPTAAHVPAKERKNERPPRAVAGGQL